MSIKKRRCWFSTRFCSSHPKKNWSLILQVPCQFKEGRIFGERKQVATKVIPSWELTYPIKNHFLKMIFLYPRCNMLVAPSKVSHFLREPLSFQLNGHRERAQEGSTHSTQRCAKVALDAKGELTENIRGPVVQRKRFSCGRILISTDFWGYVSYPRWWFQISNGFQFSPRSLSR